MTDEGAITHPRFEPRRSAGPGSWWTKAVLRAVEEAAYGQAELRRGRTLARAGSVGAITITTGGALAAVTERDETWTVEISLPVLDAQDVAAFVELVAAESGRIAALLAGELPLALVEAVEEAGVELLPYGGEFGAACGCDAWLDPCPHALAVLTQVAWLIQSDPFVLTHLRGIPRERVLRELHRLAPGSPAVSGDALAAVRREANDDADDLDDLMVAEDAAVRAARLLETGVEDW